MRESEAQVDDRRWICPAEQRRNEMETVLALAGYAVLTVVALFAALALDWILLRATFLLMQPIAFTPGKSPSADRRSRRPSIEEGTRLLARAYDQER
jgi:hypothetical protein